MLSRERISQQQFKRGTSVVDPKSQDIYKIGTTASYRCSANEGSKTSIASLSQTLSDKSYSFLNRQCSSPALSCENRGNQKQVINRISKRNLEVSHHMIKITTEYLLSSKKLVAY